MKTEETVKQIVLKYISRRPRRITLKHDWENRRSTISIVGKDLNLEFEYEKVIGFTSFANGVLDTYREAYGRLENLPISFREDLYRNEKVSLNLYPTGGAGRFDIYVEYKG